VKIGQEDSEIDYEFAVESFFLVGEVGHRSAPM
jgi:hypothetical protein